MIKVSASISGWRRVSMILLEKRGIWMRLSDGLDGFFEFLARKNGPVPDALPVVVDGLCGIVEEGGYSG